MLFVFIPGAGGAASYWSPVLPLIERAGHRAIAVELPAADPAAGLAVYAARVVAAIGTHREVVLVAQSMGGFTAALACAQAPVRALVFLNAMVPTPGETAGAWWDNTNSEGARTAAARASGYSPEFSVETYFLHDLSDALRKELAEQDAQPEAEIAFNEPCAFERWPAVPTHVLAGRDDRFFPFEFQARVARERLGVEVEPVPGGHLAALSRPQELAEKLLSIAATLR